MKIEGVDFVICPICKAKKRNLTKHIQMLHKLTKDQIVSTYPDLKLICDDTSKHISDFLKSQWENPEYAKLHTYYATKEYGNPGGAANKGKPKSEITKQRIKAYANSEEGKTIRSRNMKKSVTYMLNDPKYIEIRRINGRKQMLKNLEDEHYGHKRYKYNGVSYRSTWEVEVAKVLDSLHITYKYEPTRFTWVDIEGVERIYIPDFYLPEYNLYLEVKPDCFKTEVTDTKLNSVIASGYNAVYISTKNSTEIRDIISTLCRTKTP